MDEETSEDDGVREAAGDEFAVEVAGAEEGGAEFVECVEGGGLGGEAEGVGVEGAVFFAREVGGGLTREAFEGFSKEEGFGGRGEAVAHHEIFDEEKIAQGWHDGGEEETEAGFFLTEELIDGGEGTGEVAPQQAVAQIKNAALARDGDEGADEFGGDGGVFGGEAEFGEFEINLAAVGSDAGGENGERIVLDGDSLLVSAGGNPFLNIGFGRVESEVGFVAEEDFGELGEGFVGGTAFVGCGGTEDKFDAGGESLGEQGEEFFQSGLDGLGASHRGVSEESRAFEPDEFVASEHGQGIESLDGCADAVHGFIHGAHGTVDDLGGKGVVSGADFRGEGGGGFFDLGFIGAGDEPDGGG